MVVGASAEAYAQSGSLATGSNQSDGLRVRLPDVTVTAQKEPEPVEEAPVSVTAVTKETLDNAGARSVSEAAEFAPNTFFTEFTARKLSNARFRGVGSSPANPAITTYIDGVPQLNANSSSIELLDIDQIEFVRGPQSALFGRNTLGGLINIRTARPSLNSWGGSLVGPFGNFRAADARVNVAGPIVPGKLGLGVAVGYSSRDGYTKNEISGKDLDFRSAFFTKAQLFWVPAPAWEARVIVTGERARDGDYALNDLNALRSRPFRAQRDFEGHTWRDIVAPTFILHRAGPTVDFTTTTGVVSWKTDDATDLDYSPLPLATRTNTEKDLQFTQEVRIASSRDARTALGGHVSLRWQAGLTIFTQRYDQDAINIYGAYVLSPLVPVPVTQRSPSASLDDAGVGAYGETTFTFGRVFDAVLGLRGDFESKDASLLTSYAPTIAPPTSVVTSKSFSDVSPQFTGAYRLGERRIVYATAARGFKAGGFNAASLPGREAYDEEHSWNYEGGLKTMWLDRRLSMNASVFVLKWSDMQMNVPNPFVPGQFYISNAAGATSKGVDLELNAQVAPGCSVFGGLGYSHATFGDGSVSSGVLVAGRRIANSPAYTANLGGQYSLALTSKARLYGRAELVFRGDFYYDDANTQRQDAYSLANFRAGIRGRALFGEAWIRNAFDTRYVPVAFAYPGLAPSGFVGESGIPRTLGIRAGVTF